MPYTYRKSERLRKNTDFLSTMKGKRLSLDGLSLFYARNELGCCRVGISVGKKLTKAVHRNRIRRQIRDCISRTLQGSGNGYDLVFVARTELIGAGYEKIMRTVQAALKRTNMLGNRQESTAT
jgi:ribonuclease P protein component